MRKPVLLFLAAFSTMFISCNKLSPENYFNITVLNCNMIHGFAGNGLLREFESPSVKMVGNDKDSYSPMKRKDILDDRIQTITSNLTRVKQLNETAETKEIIAASEELYEYVLPVYENEYRELTRLYDDEASEESITSYAQLIHDKYYAGYAELLNKLIAAGKSFAEKHNIPVNWDVHTSPK